MSEFECTTDAMPSPPRDQENVYVPNGNKKRNMPMDEEEIKNDSNHFNSLPKFSFNTKPARPVINLIQVVNSPHTHIGSTIHNNITKSNEDDKTTKGEKIKETKIIMDLKNSSKPVLDKDIDAIKDHIGHGWRGTFLKLGFSQPQIDQNEIRFHNDINGLIRWLLLDWKQANGRAGATVGVLAHALWNSDQREALKRWSLQYDNLHK